MTVKTALTCDQCGSTHTGPSGSFVGWWRIERHPDAADTTTLNQLRPPLDLCSWTCVAWFATEQAPQ